MNGKYRWCIIWNVSLCFFEILKKAYHFENKDIVTDSLKYRLIGEAIAETGYEVEDKQEFLEDIEKEISRVKSDGIDIDNYYSASCPESVFQEIFTMAIRKDCIFTERLILMIWWSTHMIF